MKNISGYDNNESLYCFKRARLDVETNVSRGVKRAREQCDDINEPSTKKILVPTIDKRVVEINRSNDGRTSAYILDLNNKDNKKEIKSYDLPKELKSIDDPFRLGEYLKSVWARTSTFDNGDEKLYLSGRLRGGGLGKQQLDQLNADLKNYTSLDSIRKKEVISQVVNEVKEQRQIFNDKIANAGCKLDNLNLIVGATRAGKSTMFNYINQLPMKVKKDNESNRVLLSVDQDNLTSQQKKIYAPIGHKYVSETSIPNFAKSSISDYVYVDCAGEFDTKDVLQSIANAYFKSDLTDFAKNVKLTLVIPANNITPSGSGYFRQVLNEIGKFINDWDQFISSGSISLAITSVERGQNKQNFLSEISKLTQQVDDLGKFKDVLQDVVKREAVGLFYAPDTSDEQVKQQQLVTLQVLKSSNVDVNIIKSACPLLSEEEINTGQIISSNKYTSTSSPDQLSREIENKSKVLSQSGGKELFSMSLQPRVQLVIDAIVADLSKELDKEIHRLTYKTVKDKIIHDISSGIDPDFSTYITKCKKSSSIDNLLGSFGINKSDSIDNIQKDYNNFTKLSNISKVDNQAFDNLKIKLSESLGASEIEFNKLCQSSSVSHPGDTLKISGFAPKASEILANVTPNTKSVEVVGAYKIEIDVDLTKEKMSGKNLSLITNFLDVKDNRTIDLSGLDQSYRYQTAAPQGQDGAPGKPGNSGGNFFAYATNAPNASKLTIISNGGKGGDGQNGGMGNHAQSPSPNTSVKTGFGSDNVDDYKQDDNYYYGDEHNTNKRVAEFKKEFYHSAWFLHRLRFSPVPPTIEKSGQGKKGGDSGFPGAKGTHSLIANASNIKIKSNEGEHGIPGTGGSAGNIGSVKVYEVDYLYRTPGGLQATFALGITNLGRWMSWIEDRYIQTNYGASGNNGENGKKPNDCVIRVPQINYSSVINQAKQTLISQSNSLGDFGILATNLKQQLNTNEEVQKKLQ